MATARRLYYLDNLRIVLTLLVIVHHVAQAYGPTGGDWPVQEAARSPLLGPFFSVNRSFFMSLFFMISGYLMVPAFDRHGARTFVRGRLLRLGVPILFWVAITIPIRVLLFSDPLDQWDQVINVGHLWYLEHLLLFSLVYALWRTLRKSPVGQDQREKPLPGYATILAVALGVAVLSAVVRIWSPIDRWFNLLGFFRVAFADVPRDLAFFVFGILAYRGGWFERFPTRTGQTWLAVGLISSAAWYVYWLALSGTLVISDTAWDVIYLIWEELVCFGMCIGLLVLFREVFNRQRSLGRALAESQYAAYVVHVLIVVLVQLAVLSIPLEPFTKFILVSLISILLVFALSYGMTRPRLVRAVL